MSARRTSMPGARAATALLDTGVRLHYYEAGRSDDDVIVLLHGWPQTAWQWRHVVPLLAAAGYRVIAPDLRGAGHSSRPRRDEGVPADPRGAGLPRTGYDKRSVAEDVHALVRTELGITGPLRLVGHDIGSMVATAYALRYRDDLQWLCIGEAHLPGTEVFHRLRSTAPLYHFGFHAVLDLPEALVTGREDIYLQHFFDRLGHDPTAVDVAHYVESYSQVGALRAGFDLYRAFDQDAADVQDAVREGGKIAVPTLSLHGRFSALAEVAEPMARELADRVRTEEVPDSAHWYPEENPVGLVELLTRFDREQSPPAPLEAGHAAAPSV